MSKSKGPRGNNREAKAGVTDLQMLSVTIAIKKKEYKEYCQKLKKRQ